MKHMATREFIVPYYDIFVGDKTLAEALFEHTKGRLSLLNRLSVMRQAMLWEKEAGPAPKNYTYVLYFEIPRNPLKRLKYRIQILGA